MVDPNYVRKSHFWEHAAVFLGMFWAGVTAPYGFQEHPVRREDVEAFLERKTAPELGGKRTRRVLNGEKLENQEKLYSDVYSLTGSITLRLKERLATMEPEEWKAMVVSLLQRSYMAAFESVPPEMTVARRGAGGYKHVPALETKLVVLHPFNADGTCGPHAHELDNHVVHVPGDKRNPFGTRPDYAPLYEQHRFKHRAFHETVARICREELGINAVVIDGKALDPTVSKQMELEGGVGVRRQRIMEWLAKRNWNPTRWSTMVANQKTRERPPKTYKFEEQVAIWRKDIERLHAFVARERGEEVKQEPITVKEQARRLDDLKAAWERDELTTAEYNARFAKVLAHPIDYEKTQEAAPEAQKGPKVEAKEEQEWAISTKEMEQRIREAGLKNRQGLLSVTEYANELWKVGMAYWGRERHPDDPERNRELERAADLHRDVVQREQKPSAGANLDPKEVESRLSEALFVIRARRSSREYLDFVGRVRSITGTLPGGSVVMEADEVKAAVGPLLDPKAAHRSRPVLDEIWKVTTEFRAEMAAHRQQRQQQTGPQQQPSGQNATGPQQATTHQQKAADPPPEQEPSLLAKLAKLTRTMVDIAKWIHVRSRPDRTRYQVNTREELLKLLYLTQKKPLWFCHKAAARAVRRTRLRGKNIDQKINYGCKIARRAFKAARKPELVLKQQDVVVLAKGVTESLTQKEWDRLLSLTRKAGCDFRPLGISEEVLNGMKERQQEQERRQDRRRQTRVHQWGYNT